MSDSVKLMTSDDEDVKIANPGNGFFTEQQEDIAEIAAQQFLQQKNSGNIDKARQLGCEYAQVLLKKQSLLTREGDSDDEVHEALVLYSYVVNRVIAELSPNSILAHTALNVFYNTLEAASPEMYNHVSDTAALTLYILCERSGHASPLDIGATYASLLHRTSDPGAIARGAKLYQAFYKMCAEKHHEIGYI